MRSMLFQVGTLALVGGLALPAVANSASDSPSSVQTETEIYQDVFAPDSGSIQIEKADGSRRSAVKKVKAICAKVKATEEQKDAIRGEVLAYRENAIPIEAAEKLARLKYYKNVIAVDGSMAIAETASSDLVTAKVMKNWAIKFSLAFSSKINVNGVSIVWWPLKD